MKKIEEIKELLKKVEEQRKIITKSRDNIVTIQNELEGIIDFDSCLGNLILYRIKKLDKKITDAVFYPDITFGLKI